ncbi:MAG TPA: N-6 DNA methylase [Anaerolineae bacterium]|nr:N-6 DNA methylase [Anaerolineae bacterium]
MSTYTLTDILKQSEYALDIFTSEEIAALDIFDKRGKPYLKDFADGTERPAKPEEVVRQLFLYRLLHTYHYPAERVAVERAVYFGSAVAKKRADIVIYDVDDHESVYIIVEVKKPKRQDGIEQLKSYCNAEGAPIAVWTNGGEIEILHREDPNLYRRISALPTAHQTLTEVINEQVTIDELTTRNRLVTERLTLKSIIEDLEDLVLANAGVDAFDEVFKLIYAKLYDEWQAENAPPTRGGRLVHFRASGETNRQLYDKINGLFQKAKGQWPGVFLGDDKIDLSPAHLAVCVSFLQDIKLFNSNLQVIDEAFEYLVTQVAKGAKGQYFTPRPAIDMSVKMLNPQWGEYLIDTAAGSCGFTIHGIFHVWKGELTARRPESWQSSYAGEKVYALDFDARSVKIAQAINLIAGDGRTHVYRVNTLDPRTWDEAARVGLRDRLHRFLDDADRDAWNQQNFRYFDFDVVLTNPPFAGDIKETRLLHQYDLARKEDGKWESKVGRDLLFIERNLEFLKPGGRMAIVLPQGRFNNISDARVRAFIAERCRILAVVGLDVNTFKPHTGTKTSILFLQKWNDDPKAGVLCPKVDDYPIFFATSQHPGKDNSGNYIYLKDADGTPLLDLFGHPIVDHDLYSNRRVLDAQLAKVLERDHADSTKCEVHRANHARISSYLPDYPTIAEGFLAFAQEQGFDFAKEK